MGEQAVRACVTVFIEFGVKDCLTEAVMCEPHPKDE